MEVIIFIGLQAAGKSTFYRTRLATTHRHISKDNFRNNSNRDRRQGQLLAEALSAGESAVIDNTNPTRTSRASLIARAKASGAQVVGHYFESKVQPCLERNAQREGVAKVPDVAIYVTAQRLELPSYDEGFDALFYVRHDGKGDFVVQAWDILLSENGT